MARGPAAEDREADRADPGADVDESRRRRNPPPRRAGRRRCPPGGRASAGQYQTSAEPRVEDNASGAVAAASAGSAMAQFGGEAGLGQQPARPRFLARLDQNPPRQEAERAFDRGHVLVGDKEATPAALNSDSITLMRTRSFVRSKFDQSASSRGALAPSFGRLYGRTRWSGKGKHPWALSFRWKKSRPIG